MENSYDRAVEGSLSEWKKKLEESLVYNAILCQLDGASKDRLQFILELAHATGFSSGMVYEANRMVEVLK